MSTPHYQVSRDAARALEEFSTELFAALATAPKDQWATRFGLSATGRFKKTFPIPIHDIQLRERDGGDQFTSMYQRSLSMVPREYQFGVEEKASVIEAPDFIGWPNVPARFAQKVTEHPNKLVAAMLEANPNLGFYASPEDGLASTTALFADAHPVNVLDGSKGTFDNDQGTSTIDSALMSAAITRFLTRKSVEGENMNLRLSHVLAPPALAEAWKNLLESDHVLTALSQTGTEGSAAGWTNNRHKNLVELVVVPEFTSDDVFYFLADNGPPPWVTQAAEAPEELRFDKDSDHYKKTGKVAVSWVHTAAAAACLPHAIERVTVA